MNTAHFHLMLNHVPLVGAALAFLLLATGIAKKSAELKRAGLWVFVLAALVTIPVYLTGEPAEEIVEHLPGVSEPIVEQHERAALFSLIAIEVLGLVSLAGLFVSRRAADVSKPFVAAALAASVIVAGLMAWTANLGGQVRHTEIRLGNVAGSPPTEKNEAERHGATPKKEKKEHEE